MATSFDRWLAKPSTICLLRRVIHSETNVLLPPGRPRQGRRWKSAPVASEEQNKYNKGSRKVLGDSAERVRKKDSIELRQSTRAMLFMSLRTGVPLLHPTMNKSSAADEMQFQTDVDAPARMGRLAVDEPENRNNMALWSEILQVRHRLHGREGLEAVWNGIRKRKLDLPTEGPHADFLWRTFVHGSVLHSDVERTDVGDALVEDIFEHAKDLCDRTGQRYQGLYKAVVGRWLHLDPKSAQAWHQRLVSAGLAKAAEMWDVTADLMQSADPMLAFNAFFRPSYMELDRRDLYDRVIAEALVCEVPLKVALRYHQLLLAHGDAPSQVFFRDAGVQKLFELDGDRSLPMKTAKVEDSRAKDVSSGLDNQHTRVSRETMSVLVGNVHDIKPKEFSDAFCARMFATRAFSLGWVLKGLAMFGADRLGPLAMREMAVRAESIETFCSALKEMKELGISPGDATFCRLAVKVAQEGNAGLWQAMLESDQHPETYDDVDTQSRLLAAYMGERRWLHAHLTLMVASLSGARPSFRAWNDILQHYIQSYDYTATVSTMQTMQSERVPLSSYSCNMLKSHVLPPRTSSKRPEKRHGPGYFEPTEFVANAYLYAIHQRKPPRPGHWVEVMKRLGMNHQWQLLERVVLTLLALPSRSIEDEAWSSESDPRDERLRAIFSSNMRKAIFIWGFRCASVRNQLRPAVFVQRRAPSGTGSIPNAKVERWAQGLPLLQRLRDSGFDFDVSDVRIVFVQRMWILFGPGYSTLAINHEARRQNQLSLAHYIRHANEVWDGLVDWVPPQLLERDGDPQLLTAFFGRMQSTSVKRGELVDVQTWSAALSSGKGYMVEPRRTRDKERAWMQSPLRITYHPMQPPLTPTSDTPSPRPQTVSTPTPRRPSPPAHQSPAAR